MSDPGEKLHIVFINQYFPPDGAPTGLMLGKVAQQLVEDGHEVTVLCSSGGYTRSENSTLLDGNAPRVVRIPATSFGRFRTAGKLADYASFYLGVATRLLSLSPPPDRVVSLTTPPDLSLLGRVCSRLKGGDHAHWVMDLYPDVMTAHGMIGERGLPHRMLGALARFGMGGRRASSIVVLGPDMEERVGRLLGNGREIDWVPLWQTTMVDASESTEAQAKLLRHERGWAADDVVFMYSGNMGLGHRFDDMLDAASRPSTGGPRRRFAFFGEGKRRAEIISRSREGEVELHDRVSMDKLAAHLASADVHLASMDAKWDGTMVPSKLQGSFAAGRPVLFIGSENSSIGRWIKNSGGGWVVPAGDAEAMDAALQSASDAKERQQRGSAALDFARKHFDPGTNARQVAGIFSKPPVGKR